MSLVDLDRLISPKSANWRTIVLNKKQNEPEGAWQNKNV